MIRRQIEEGFEVIGTVDDEIRGIVARNWPHLLFQAPPMEVRQWKNESDPKPMLALGGFAKCPDCNTITNSDHLITISDHQPRFGPRYV